MNPTTATRQPATHLEQQPQNQGLSSKLLIVAHLASASAHWQMHSIKPSHAIKAPLLLLLLQVLRTIIISFTKLH
jgi:hypothetical protein